MIAVVDYGLGNLSSVRKTFEALDKEVEITTEAEILRRSELIVLPGMGAFGKGMQRLMELGLNQTLKELVMTEKKPLLGICLGMQLLADKGFEFGKHKGLGFIGGEVRRLEIDNLRIPHMGWNDIVPKDSLFDGINATDPSFYFAHSYHFIPSEGSSIAATADYGREFVCALRKEHIFATQFHPEKSQTNGLILLRNLLKCLKKD